MRLEPLVRDRPDVALLHVRGRVEAAHLIVRELAAVLLQRTRERGVALERRDTHHRRRLVGREVAPVVLERDEAQRRDLPVGGIARDHIHLALRQGAVGAAQVHRGRRRGEAEPVDPGQPREAVGALEKLVAEARVPARRHPAQVRNRLQPVAPGVGRAHQDGERVVEPERREPAQAELPAVFVCDLAIHAVAVGDGRVLEHRGERRARVLDVQVDLPRHDGVMAHERAAQVQPPLHWDVHPALDLLRHDFGQEIVAQQIERRVHVPVERRLHLGGTFVCHHAIMAGQIDLYVEYSGTAFTAVLKHPPVADRDSVYRQVANEYSRQFRLRWLAPFGFDNTFAILVRAADAGRYGLKAISDLSRVAPRWQAGFGYAFLERADGFAGLSRVAGPRFAAPPAAMDLAPPHRAPAEAKVDVIAGNSTDGQIAALRLVALEDDRRYFPPYEAAPVVRDPTLERHATLARALEELGGKIADDEMRRLNAAADVEHRDIRTIAHEWLEAHVP